MSVLVPSVVYDNEGKQINLKDASEIEIKREVGSFSHEQRMGLTDVVWLEGEFTIEQLKAILILSEAVIISSDKPPPPRERSPFDPGISGNSSGRAGAPYGTSTVDSQATAVKEKEKPVCRHCGSDNVVIDGVARWDDEAQDWKLSGTHDSGHCDNCEEDFKRLDWTPVENKT